MGDGNLNACVRASARSKRAAANVMTPSTGCCVVELGHNIITVFVVRRVSCVCAIYVLCNHLTYDAMCCEIAKSPSLPQARRRRRYTIDWSVQSCARSASVFISSAAAATAAAFRASDFESLTAFMRASSIVRSYDRIPPPMPKQTPVRSVRIHWFLCWWWHAYKSLMKFAISFPIRRYVPNDDDALPYVIAVRLHIDIGGKTVAIYRLQYITFNRSFCCVCPSGRALSLCGGVWICTDSGSIIVVPSVTT